LAGALIGPAGAIVVVVEAAFRSLPLFWPSLGMIGAAVLLFLVAYPRQVQAMRVGRAYRDGRPYLRTTEPLPPDIADIVGGSGTDSGVS